MYKPTRPKSKQNLIVDYTKLKTPHFFVYAKDKEKDKVEKINNSVVNRLSKIIPNPNINFKNMNLGDFDYTILMKNKNIELNQDIIEKYTNLDLKKHFMINKTNDEELNNITYLYEDIKNQLIEINSDIYYITDVLVKYLYEEKKSNFKTTLWECFGNIIIENIKNNLMKKFNNKAIQCECCGKIIEARSNKQKFCEDCFKDINKEQIRKRVEKYRKNEKCNDLENR